MSCGHRLLDRGQEKKKSPREERLEKALMKQASSKETGKITGMIRIMFGEKGIIIARQYIERPSVLACFAARQAAVEMIDQDAANRPTGDLLSELTKLKDKITKK